jgi:hypothetical protein
MAARFRTRPRPSSARRTRSDTGDAHVRVAPRNLFATDAGRNGGGFIRCGLTRRRGVPGLEQTFHCG